MTYDHYLLVGILFLLCVIVDQLRALRRELSTQKSAPPFPTPHNSDERLPSSDAAAGWADTRIGEAS